MREFSIDPRKKLRSRLWHWGVLSASVVGWVALSLFPLPKEMGLLYYLVAFLAIDSALLVFLAEREYAVNEFTFDGQSCGQGRQQIRISDVEQLVWVCGMFPQTDKGGCELKSNQAGISILFGYLSDQQTLQLIKLLRQTIPADRQRNWPRYCHSIALRIFFQLRHPDRDLPEPTAEEAESQERAAKRRGRVMFGILFFGLALACAVYLCLDWVGIRYATGWAFGVVVVARIAAQALAFYLIPSADRAFIESQRVWDEEVVNASIVA